MTKLVLNIIRVLNEAVSVRVYRVTVGSEVVDRLELDRFTLIRMFLPTSGFGRELTINHGRHTPYDPNNGTAIFPSSWMILKLLMLRPQKSTPVLATL